MRDGFAIDAAVPGACAPPRRNRRRSILANCRRSLCVERCGRNRRDCRGGYRPDKAIP
jgi:hypothetical protein